MGVTIEGGGSKPPKPPTPSSSSSKSKGSTTSSSSSSSSSGSSAQTKSYVQLYRLLFGGNVKPNMSLIREAVANNWSGSYFKMQVRLRDKNYFKSQEAKARAVDFQDYWKAVFPGAKVNRKVMRQYLRSSWTQGQLEQQLTKLPAFRKQYKFYNQFASAQREAGAAKNVDPLVYRKWMSTFNDAYKQLGMPAPEGYLRQFFRSGISDQEFISNLGEYTKSASAAQWDIGGLDQKQQANVLFSGRGSVALRSQLQQALNKQQRYFQAAGSQFGVARDDSTVTLQGL
jgi:hypothetical protein